MLAELCCHREATLRSAVPLDPADVEVFHWLLLMLRWTLRTTGCAPGQERAAGNLRNRRRRVPPQLLRSTTCRRTGWAWRSEGTAAGRTDLETETSRLRFRA